jgi:phosphoribosylformylglycinamidine cyclo-ligase
VLRYLQQLAAMSEEEAYGTFNMGAGYAFFVPPADVDRALQLASQLGQPLSQIGHLEAGPRQVLLQPLGIRFDDASLQIR